MLKIKCPGVGFVLKSQVYLSRTTLWKVGLIAGGIGLLSQAAQAGHPLGWVWGFDLGGGYSHRAASSPENVTRSGYHLNIGSHIAYAWPKWFTSLTLGAGFNYFGGSESGITATNETLAFMATWDGRFRLGSWLLGPQVNLWAGQDVSFPEEIGVTGPSTALFAGLGFEREIKLWDLYWRAGAYGRTDLTIAARQIWQVGASLALDLPIRTKTPYKKGEAQIQAVDSSTVIVNLNDAILHFAFDVAQLSDAGKKLLQRISDVLLTNSTTWQNLRLEGHTDKKGSVQYNQELSFRRANSVAIELQRLGLAPDRVSTRGFGASRPVYFGEDFDQFYQNRRVELFIEGVTDSRALADQLRERLSDLKPETAPATRP